MSDWEKRITASGFVQYRETSGKWKSRWQFQVISFRGEPCTMGTCRVMASDVNRDVPIDAKNRIKIDGKWFSHLHWNH